MRVFGTGRFSGLVCVCIIFGEFFAPLVSQAEEEHQDGGESSFGKDGGQTNLGLPVRVSAGSAFSDGGNTGGSDSTTTSTVRPYSSDTPKIRKVTKTSGDRKSSAHVRSPTSTKGSGGQATSPSGHNSRANDQQWVGKKGGHLETSLTPYSPILDQFFGDALQTLTGEASYEIGQQQPVMPTTAQGVVAGVTGEAGKKGSGAAGGLKQTEVAREVEEGIGEDELNNLMEKIIPPLNRDNSYVLANSLDIYDPVPYHDGNLHEIDRLIDSAKLHSSLPSKREKQRAYGRLRAAEKGQGRGWQVPQMFKEVRAEADALIAGEKNAKLAGILRRRGFVVPQGGAKADGTVIDLVAATELLDPQDSLRKAIEEEVRIAHQKDVNLWLRHQHILRKMWADGRSGKQPVYQPFYRFKPGDDNVPVSGKEDLDLNYNIDEFGDFLDDELIGLVNDSKPKRLDVGNAEAHK